MKKLLIIAAVLASAAPVLAAPPGAAEASIGDADKDGIQDFQANDNQSIFLLTKDNRWFLATLAAPCEGLDQKKAHVSYEPNMRGVLDRTSSIQVAGHSCALQSLVASGPPPRKPKG